MLCRSCDALVINGLLCHEFGCPDRKRVRPRRNRSERELRSMSLEGREKESDNDRKTVCKDGYTAVLG